MPEQNAVSQAKETMIDHVRLARKYGGAAPRYTSYPTAPHFHAGVIEDTYRAWLATMNAGESASLYLHVPYCRQLCWYCGCNTRATQTYDPVARYLTALVEEVVLVERAMPKKPIVQRLHWGGGTPTILTGGDFLQVMQKLRNTFDFASNAEIAIEIDPRTLTESKAEILAGAGVTRASLGVQVFAQHVQDAINRRQSYQQVVRSVAMLRVAGVKSISFDLMYGLPKQTIADIEETATLAAELSPDRISVFGYAHVPWMKPHQRLIDEATVPGEFDRPEQAAAAARILEQAGYQPIGLDHFALPGDSLSALAKSGGLRRNFQGYTDDQENILLGFGTSAIGSLPQGYVQNISDTRGYLEAIKNDRLPIARGVEISNEDRLRRNIIERLMCDYSTDLGSICAKHGASPDLFSAERRRLEEFADDGLVVLDGDVITIPFEFRPYVRSVCAVFDTYFKTGKGRHSRVI